MTFPTVVTTSSGSGAWNLTTTLPSGVTAGDLLICFVAMDDGNNAITALTAHTGSGAGWNIQFQDASAAVVSSVFWKVADGDDALIIGQTGAGIGESASYVFYRISGQHGSTSPEFASQDYATFAGTPTTAPTSPVLDPSGWATEDTLWLWGGANDNGTVTLSAYPTDFSSNQLVASGGASGDVRMAAATFESAVDSMTARAGTLSSAEQWISWMVAVRPASTAGTSVRGRGLMMGIG